MDNYIKNLLHNVALSSLNLMTPYFVEACHIHMIALMSIYWKSWTQRRSSPVFVEMPFPVSIVFLFF